MAHLVLWTLTRMEKTMGSSSVFAGTIAELTWVELSEAAERGALMLVPVAVIEQHGPHLPLGTDTYAAWFLCRDIAQQLAEMGVEALIAPPFYLGINTATGMFPGSIGMDEGTMVAALSGLLSNLGRFGFKRQFIVNHHGDPLHNRGIAGAVNAARGEGIDAILTLGGWVGELVEDVHRSAYGASLPIAGEAVLRVAPSKKTLEARDRLMRSPVCIHAEERETSFIMRYFPELLNESKGRVSELPPVLPAPDQLAAALGDGKWREVSPLGYIGSPGAATVENGELYAYEAADMALAIKEFVSSK